MSNLNLASIQDDDNASPSVTSPDFLTVGVDGHHYAVNPSHSQLNNGTHVDQLDSFNSITVTPSVVRDATSIPSRQDDMDPETDLDSSSDVTYDSHVSEFPRLTDATGLDAPASPWKEDGPHPSTWETEYQLWRTPDSPFLDRMKALRRERKVREKLKRIIEDPSLRDLPGSTVVPGEIDTILTALAARESRTTRHKDSCGRTQSSNDSTPHLTTLALAAIGNEFNVSVFCRWHRVTMPRLISSRSQIVALQRQVKPAQNPPAALHLWRLVTCRPLGASRFFVLVTHRHHLLMKMTSIL